MATARIFQSMCNKLLTVLRDAHTEYAFPTPHTVLQPVTTKQAIFWRHVSNLCWIIGYAKVFCGFPVPQWKCWGSTSIWPWPRPSKSCPFCHPFYRLTFLCVCYWQKGKINRSQESSVWLHKYSTYNKSNILIYACSYAELLLERGGETYRTARQLETLEIKA